MELQINKNSLIGLAFFVFIAILFFTRGFGLISSTGKVLAATDGVMEIPLSEISETAKWYDYESSGEKVRFFVVKSNDGSIKTALDACDVCYGSKKGYSQDGEYMVCNNCGNRYLISDLGTKNKAGGGCWPGYLPHEIEGNNIAIKKSDLEKNSWRF